jgi:hypothetical protein
MQASVGEQPIVQLVRLLDTPGMPVNAAASRAPLDPTSINVATFVTPSAGSSARGA